MHPCIYFPVRSHNSLSCALGRSCCRSKFGLVSTTSELRLHLMHRLLYDCRCLVSYLFYKLLSSRCQVQAHQTHMRGFQVSWDGFPPLPGLPSWWPAGRSGVESDMFVHKKKGTLVIVTRRTFEKGGQEYHGRAIDQGGNVCLIRLLGAL